MLLRGRRPITRTSRSCFTSRNMTCYSSKPANSMNIRTSTLFSKSINLHKPSYPHTPTAQRPLSSSVQKIAHISKAPCIRPSSLSFSARLAKFTSFTARPSHRFFSSHSFSLPTHQQSFLSSHKSPQIGKPSLNTAHRHTFLSLPRFFSSGDLSQIETKLQDLDAEIPEDQNLEFPLDGTRFLTNRRFRKQLSPKFQEAFKSGILIKNNGENLHDLLFRLPKFGVGMKLTRSIWKRSGCYWTITRYVPETANGGLKRGKAYGYLTWRHVVTPDTAKREYRVVGPLKREWVVYNHKHYEAFRHIVEKNEDVRDIPVLAHTHTVEPGFKMPKMEWEWHTAPGF